MAATNKHINAWTLQLLKIKPHENILEIGFGPGLALQSIVALLEEGTYTGVDPSKAMHTLARKRNGAAVTQGKVKLHFGAVEQLPELEDKFDVVLTVNSILFWEQPEQCLQHLRQKLKSKGRIAVTLQPHTKGETDETARQKGEKIVEDLQKAGFTEVRLETIRLFPVSAVCAIGVNP
ncbi:class I SAM-dependent methyltransferase [Paenibacillus turpanensis]|uniref:class I SAM-dependent methyltransferase n=1 Tax=Paenibacillus turpanensis TaxID=2689078 RepID=UPI001FB7BE1A|nr:class I SAM-dependent methyltransferase [Paenibacillus turpanensis]